MTKDMEENANYEQLLVEIAKLFQRKYKHMTEIARLTDEMAAELQRGDKVSVQMMIEMRGDEIDGVRDCDRKLRIFQESVPDKMRNWMDLLLEGKAKSSEGYGKEGELLVRLSANIRSVWEKMMEVDRHMSRRLAGDDSFYTGKQQ